MRFDNLSDWLRWQEQLHFTEVDPGLDRISQVWQRLNGVTQLAYPVVTIAGTNGKGSSVAMLDAILRSAGYKTGCYTSPHLLDYNERICIAGQCCDDDAICQAFQQIDDVRGDISLTYFEFATLAAILIFNQQQIDIAILEVGMGGRLDAVNLFEPDISLITPISLDHTAWLGEDKESIAYEKAGIIRADKPVVCSEPEPANAIINKAKQLNAPLYCSQRDYHVENHSESWSWSNHQQTYHHLPKPNLTGDYQVQNAAAVLQVVSLLAKQFTISEPDVRAALETVTLAGRFQQFSGDVDIILDVTHNQQGAKNLAQLLAETAYSGQTFAVLAMLKDKDVSAVVESMSTQIDRWYLASLFGSRGLAVSDLAAEFYQLSSVPPLNKYNSVIEAFQQANSDAKPGDRIIAFGSFHTVEAVMHLLHRNDRR